MCVCACMWAITYECRFSKTQVVFYSPDDEGIHCLEPHTCVLGTSEPSIRDMYSLEPPVVEALFFVVVDNSLNSGIWP